MILYLDGIFTFDATLDCYLKDEVSWVKKELWSRITLLVQAALYIINTVVMQGLRSAGSLIAGILTVDERKLQNGCNDLLSILVQVVTLAVLGVFGTFHPKVASQLAKKLLNRKTMKDPSSSCASVLRLAITGVVRGILGMPIGIVDGVTMGISGVICGSKGQFNLAARHFKEAFLSPLLGFVVTRFSSAKETVWDLHSM